MEGTSPGGLKVGMWPVFKEHKSRVRGDNLDCAFRNHCKGSPSSSRLWVSIVLLLAHKYKTGSELEILTSEKKLSETTNIFSGLHYILSGCMIEPIGTDRTIICYL